LKKIIAELDRIAQFIEDFEEKTTVIKADYPEYTIIINDFLSLIKKPISLDDATKEKVRVVFENLSKSLEENESFSINLMLAKGTHNITVVVQSETAYVIDQLRFLGGVKFVPISATSDSVFFNVVEPVKLDSESFPTMPITESIVLISASIATAALASVGLLVYLMKYRKRYQKRSN
jgi:hypothetical protein